MYDFAPEQFKTIIQKSFVEISEGKSINTHAIREAFREISKKNHITDGTPYDWEIGPNNNRRQTDGEGVIDGGAKKWMIPKGMQPKPLPPNAGTSTTPTIEDENDENNDKVQESTNLDETPSVMLRRVVFEKNNENNGVEGK